MSGMLCHDDLVSISLATTHRCRTGMGPNTRKLGLCLGLNAGACAKNWQRFWIWGNPVARFTRCSHCGTLPRNLHVNVSTLVAAYQISETTRFAEKEFKCSGNAPRACLHSHSRRHAWAGLVKVPEVDKLLALCACTACLPPSCRSWWHAGSCQKQLP